MKHYFRSGARGYMYWNISTATGGTSTWGWAQNSLVCVDTAAKTFRYNHDYYLLKHLTHFVDVGAKRVESNRHLRRCAGLRESRRHIGPAGPQ